MKHFYIPVGILAVILGFSLWTGRYVEQRTEHWNTLLTQADQAGYTEHWDAAREQMEQIYQDWKNSQTLFNIILSQDELEEAENLFAGAFAMCREEDDADFHQLLAQLTKQIDLLAETQRTSIKNIL